MKNISHGFFGGLAVLLFTLTWVGDAAATFSMAYPAPADPITEGFLPFVAIGMPPQVNAPLADDQGCPAWSLAGSELGAQFYYLSGPLSPFQKANIDGEEMSDGQETRIGQGFILTMRGRVVQDPNAPAYDDGFNTVIGGVNLDLGSRRYDLALGLTRSGKTVVVLNTDFDESGPGGSLRVFGPSYMLHDAGYHIYDLVFNPQIQSASLFIDGIERIGGYIGHGLHLHDTGLSFGLLGAGGLYVNVVQLVSGDVCPPGHRCSQHHWYAWPCHSPAPWAIDSDTGGTPDNLGDHQ